MSDKNVGYKLNPFSYSSPGIRRMGNLFSKQGLESSDEQSNTLQSEIQTFQELHQDSSQDTENIEPANVEPGSKGPAITEYTKHERNKTLPSKKEFTKQELKNKQARTREDALKEMIKKELDRAVEFHSERVILDTVFREMYGVGLPPEKCWLALQHYIFYVYRNLLTANPYNNGDKLPTVISRAIGGIFDVLLQADTAQICIKLVALLRNYVKVVKNHIDNGDFPNIIDYLVDLMGFYSALCTSAGKFAPLLPEFDFVILGRYNINWIGVNKSVFYHHIYLSSSVQAKLPLINKLHEANDPSLRDLLQTFACFTEDMQALANKWASLKTQITTESKIRARSKPKKQLARDWDTYKEHKKILRSPLWLNRPENIIKMQDMKELDSHVLAWVADKSPIAEPRIDDKGHCLCEDCLSEDEDDDDDTDSTATASALSESSQSEPSRCFITCYVCQGSVVLDTFFHHILLEHTAVANTERGHRAIRELAKQENTLPNELLKSHESLYEGLKEKNEQIKQSLIQLIDSTSPQNHRVSRHKNKRGDEAREMAYQVSNTLSSALCGLVEAEKLKYKPGSGSGESAFSFNQTAQSLFQSDENAFKTTREAILKIASESSLFQKGEEDLLMEAENSSEEYKVFFEQMKRLVENTDSEYGRKPKVECASKNTQTPNVKKSSGTNTDENLLAASTECSSSFRKPQHKGVGGNVDSKVLDFLKHANVGTKRTPSTSSDDDCSGHACGHKCNHDDDDCCMDSCDHHKDSRKCDCAYCEVFGSTFLTNTPKPSETRERLRSRLNQRKEKENENIDATGTTSLSPKACVSKAPKSTKTPLTNAKTNLAKVVKSVTTEPPRVPELHHPVPPPGNTKTVTGAVEVKKAAVAIDKSTALSGSKISQARTTSIPESTTEPCSGHRSPSSMSTCSLLSESVDCRDINELLNYIEGTKTVDKVAIAHKKAAKKARQRSKKVNDKEEIDRAEAQKLKDMEEARLQAEKLKEEERRKAEALAKQLAEKQKVKIKKEDKKVSTKQEIKKVTKKKSNKTEILPKVSNKPKVYNIDTTNATLKSSGLMEETIPAMVTIKRSSEGTNAEATVTITLKGSSPDTDKLLFTLVNGSENNTKASIIEPNKVTIKKTLPTKPAQPVVTKVVTESVKPKKKKEQAAPIKPMKAPIAAAKKEPSLKMPAKMETFASCQLQHAYNHNKESEISYVQPPANNIKESSALPMLNLPPGITITKIEGPPSIGSCKYTTSTNSQYTTQNPTLNGHRNINVHPSPSLNHNPNYNLNPIPNPNIPSSKSGVIVVDTEKLIQQSIEASIHKRNKKLNKKKRDPNVVACKPPESTKLPDAPSMVTLKNPIFETPPQLNKSPDKQNFDFPSTRKASIFKGENGMVTIRSPRSQNPFDNGAPVSSYFSDIQPMYSPDVGNSYMSIPPKPTYYESCNASQYSQYKSHYHAHEFLAGLPGIEITKINKAAYECENKPPKPVVEAPSAPTNNVVNGINTFNFDADDWYYENIFNSKDALEDDMDDEELELEEFNRCYQTPHHQEKVNNLCI